MKNFKPDFILYSIVIAFLMAFGGGMFLKGIALWWVLLLIAFVLVAIYAERRAEEDAEDAYEKFMRSDYYDSYESDDASDAKADEFITMLEEGMKNGMKENTLSSKLSKCNKCGNKVYEICMCKPVKRRKKAKDLD